MQNVSFIFQFPEDREFRFPNVNMEAGSGDLVNFARAINALQKHTASNVLLESRTSLTNNKQEDIMTLNLRPAFLTNTNEAVTVGFKKVRSFASNRVH